MKKKEKKNIARYNKSLKLVNQIQKIRSKNNKNWMDLLRLSLKLDHKKTSKILSEIYKSDQRISGIAKKIYKLLLRVSVFTIFVHKTLFLRIILLISLILITCCWYDLKFIFWIFKIYFVVFYKKLNVTIFFIKFISKTDF